MSKKTIRPPVVRRVLLPNSLSFMICAVWGMQPPDALATMSDGATRRMAPQGMRSRGPR